MMIAWRPPPTAGRGHLRSRGEASASAPACALLAVEMLSYAEFGPDVPCHTRSIHQVSCEKLTVYLWGVPHVGLVPRRESMIGAQDRRSIARRTLK